MWILLSANVVLEVPELKVIHHLEPIVLIGADVLCGGHKVWCFRSMGISAMGQGVITFAKGRRMVPVPLVNAPMLGQPRFILAPNSWGAGEVRRGVHAHVPPQAK